MKPETKRSAREHERHAKLLALHSEDKDGWPPALLWERCGPPPKHWTKLIYNAFTDYYAFTLWLVESANGDDYLYRFHQSPEHDSNYIWERTKLL